VQHDHSLSKQTREYVIWPFPSSLQCVFLVNYSPFTQSLTVCSMTIGTRLAEGEFVHLSRDSAEGKAAKGWYDRIGFLRIESGNEWARARNITRKPRRRESDRISWQTRQQWSIVESSLRPFSSRNHDLKLVLRWEKWMENIKQIDPQRPPWISSGQIDQVAGQPGQERIQIHQVNVSSSHGQQSVALKCT